MQISPRRKSGGALPPLLKSIRCVRQRRPGRALADAIAGKIRLTVLQFDFREGGSYRFAYYAPDATTVTVTGSYSVLKRARRLFSHGS